MKIEILGTGCDRCNKLFAVVQDAVAQSGADAELLKVESLDEIMKHGVMLPPALVIDGEVKCQGQLPKPEQLAAWIEQAARG